MRVSRRGLVYSWVQPTPELEVVNAAQVRVSSDLRKAFIEYTTLPRARGAAAVHLQRHAGRLRSQIFSALAVPFSPMLEFKERGTNLPQEQLDAAFDRIHSETEDNSKTREC
eukprot:SM000014S00305  [mRNA]  locus=s14:640169:640764:+ [translate_table: standard]